ncbi:U3 small nucleolar ribonucleoprotein LCP5 [Zopfia rhizophila CBS 207.26]|uniref:U3 small nucleolar ribonucleoprotein LCP5 n=1 Tax=Zopfia rhizophila CBS 207.26 TaxID=1314779 RepID=A0A6A6EVJ4_9PEZI|nr:U3 small nucleolar ribonucleoprotein LCP5 [Zopfia rhizophila CBS 207.26]
MAVDNSLCALLTTLITSIESAAGVLPDENVLLPPKDGISLLDAKNELLLSYLQNLVFLILLKLRSRSEPEDDGDADGDTRNIYDEVIKKLVELRVYLEKGVRPLESRLKYQIDKIVRAADDSTRKANQKPGGQDTTRASKISRAHLDPESEVSEGKSDGSAQTEEDIDDLSYGPNRSAVVRPHSAGPMRAAETSKDGVYKPPRIAPMAMPTTQGRGEKESRRLGKSATLDEFVATELSAAPVAEPSIGSTIVSGGRHMKSERERRDEAERQAYEEANFVRLPKESKKERAKKRNQNRDGGWGGEEWRGLGSGLGRIERLTQKRGGSLGSLEKSRKRSIQDGPRGTGSEAGEMFEKRRKVLSRYRK